MLDAITDGDSRRVARELRGLSEAQRRALAPEVLRYARSVPGSNRESVAHVALLGTATFKEIRRFGGWSASMVNAQYGLEVLLDRRPSWLQAYAEWRLTADRFESPWSLVRGLVRAGAIERPGPPYLSAMIREGRPNYPGDSGAAQLVADDPALLEREVWDLLTQDTGEESLRAADEGQGWGAGWGELIQARLPRARVLDAVLEGLANDMVAYRAAWHTKLWKALAPTREDRAERADRLRLLLGAAADPIVTFAVEELGRAKVTVPAGDLAPALAAASKKTVRGALKLLGEDAAAATIALGHPDAAIQGEVLDRLERWELDDEARAALLGQLDLLAATQRPRAEALLNLKVPGTFISAPSVELDGIPETIRTALNFGGPLPPAPIPGEPVLGEPVQPLTLEALADAFRDQDSAFLHERALDAILRHCATREPFDGPLAPLVERFEEVAASDALISTWGVAASWLTGKLPTLRNAASLRGRQIEAVGRRAARGEAGPLLALPTHAGGWIDPRVLVERVRGPIDEVEFTVALLRLAPDGRAEALAAAADLPGRPGQVLRCALGGEPVDGGDWPAEAARAVAGLTPIVVEVDRLRVTVHEPHPPHGVGPLGEVLNALDQRIRWDHFTDPFAFPVRRDLAAAATIMRISLHLEGDYATASGSSELLKLLLAEREPIAPLTLRLLVLALGSTWPGEHLLAVDVLITAIEDGRIDALPPDDVALLKPNRLAPRLTTIAEAGPLQRAVVREFLDVAVVHLPARSGPLLVLFDELCAQTETGPNVSREHLRTLKHKAARSLVKREGDPPASEAQLALAARVRRARRWMAA